MATLANIKLWFVPFAKGLCHPLLSYVWPVATYAFNIARTMEARIGFRHLISRMCPWPPLTNTDNKEGHSVSSGNTQHAPEQPKEVQ